MPTGIDPSAYRIVQEGLTNALEHAGPARALVRVRDGEDEPRVEIEDDGGGPPARVNGAGHGLAGMRERVGLSARPAGGPRARGRSAR